MNLGTLSGAAYDDARSNIAPTGAVFRLENLGYTFAPARFENKYSTPFRACQAKSPKKSEKLAGLAKIGHMPFMLGSAVIVIKMWAVSAQLNALFAGQRNRLSPLGQWGHHAARCPHSPSWPLCGPGLWSPLITFAKCRGDSSATLRHPAGEESFANAPPNP